jgi:hypothetical protein
MTVTYSWDLLSLDPAQTASTVSGLAAPVGRDLTLDATTGDILLQNGDLYLTTEYAAIAQDVRIRLRFFQGEWFLDLDAGVPFFQSLLVKSPNLAAIREIIGEKILEADGVKSITKLTLDFDKATRELSVRATVNTDLGELNLTTLLETA